MSEVTFNYDTDLVSIIRDTYSQEPTPAATRGDLQSFADTIGATRHLSQMVFTNLHEGMDWHYVEPGKIIIDNFVVGELMGGAPDESHVKGIKVASLLDLRRMLEAEDPRLKRMGSKTSKQFFTQFVDAVLL